MAEYAVGYSNRQWQERQKQRRAAALLREHRRQEVIRLASRGLSCKEIGERLGASHQTAWRDIQAVRAEWRVARLDAFEEYRNRERGRLELVIKEAWAAWYRSLRPHNKRRIESEPDKGGEPKPTKIVVAEIVEEPDGDPRYLEVIRKSSESLRKLDGLDEPERKEFSGPGSGPIPVAGLIQLVKQIEEMPPAPTDAEMVRRAIGFDPERVGNDDPEAEHDSREGELGTED